MADQARRGRNRPDSRQMWDESDRRTRNRHGDYAPRGHDRDRRYRSRSRSPRRDRGNRRDRSRDRSRDRRDRDRDRDYDRRPRDDRDGRARGSRYDERPPDGRRSDDRDGPRHHNREDGGGGRDRDRNQTERGRNQRYSVSPPRSPANKEPHSEHNSPLPSRPKADRSGGPLSFKVGKHVDAHDRASRGRGGDSDVQDSVEHDDRHRGNSAFAEELPRSPRRGERRGDAMDEDDEEEEDDDVVVEDEGMDMAAMMGFGGFGTTKNSKVAGNNAYAVRKEKKTEYRQYMNRVGGFNRPLSPGR